MRSAWKNNLIALASVAGIVAVWKVLSLITGSSIILPSPELTGRVLAEFLRSPDFWMAVGATAVRGLLGFAVAVILGISIGIAAGLSGVLYRLFQPILTVVRSVPVMSVMLLALIWFSGDAVPVFVSLLITFPVITGNVIDGIRSSDTELIEMARVYGVKRGRLVWELLLPSILPFVVAGSSTAMGLTWKVVVAAEVLSQPKLAIGSGLFESKTQLETAGVFAWTLAAVGLSFLFEGLIRVVEKRVVAWRREQAP